MATLLNPTNPIRKGVRWAFVAHTVFLFLFVTVSFGIYFADLSIEYIDNREFPGNDELNPGPTGTTASLPSMQLPLFSMLCSP